MKTKFDVGEIVFIKAIVDRIEISGQNSAVIYRVLANGRFDHIISISEDQLYKVKNEVSK